MKTPSPESDHLSKPQTYTVFIDDNFNFMDEEERTTDSVHGTFDAALARAKVIIEQSLHHLRTPSMSAAELLEHYNSFGDDPWIMPTPAGMQRFSAWDHAEKRCAEICAAACK